MTDLDKIPTNIMRLPAATTVSELIQRLAVLDPDDRLVGDHHIVTASIPPEPAGQPADEPDPVAEALAVPHLPAIARKLRQLPAAPGRPKILDAAMALQRDVKRPAADEIARTLAALPWPPDWLPPLPPLPAGADR